MAGRGDELTGEQQIQLGVEVRKARLCRVPWKVLVNVYNRSRIQLWRYAQLAAPPQDETSFLQDETSAALS